MYKVGQIWLSEYNYKYEIKSISRAKKQMTLYSHNNDVTFDIPFSSAPVYLVKEVKESEELSTRSIW